MISQANPALHTAMESSCLLMKISSPADALWSGLLLDPVNLPLYIELNQSKLATSYARAIKFLKSHQIDYRNSNAGHFIWIDLRRFLPEVDSLGQVIKCDFKREDELALKFATAGVNVVRY